MQIPYYVDRLQLCHIIKIAFLKRKRLIVVIDPATVALASTGQDQLLHFIQW